MATVNIHNHLWSIGNETRKINSDCYKIQTFLEKDDVVEAYSMVADILQHLTVLTEDIMILDEGVASMIPEEMLYEELNESECNDE